MPLQVCAIPIKLPDVACSDEGCLGDWEFMRVAVSLPHRPYLDNLKALALEPETQVDFLTQVDRWTASHNELTDNVLNLPFFKII